MSAKCEICNGVGWVCRNHLDSPWNFDKDECSVEPGCGNACNCLCNPNGEYDFETTYASTEPEKVKKWAQ